MEMSIVEQRKRWGGAIRTARRRAGFSQEQLAGKWQNSLSYLQKIETGSRGNEEIYRELLDVIGKARSGKRRKPAA